MDCRYVVTQLMHANVCMRSPLLLCYRTGCGYHSDRGGGGGGNSDDKWGATDLENCLYESIIDDECVERTPHR